ncbi:glycosyltransferase family 4 protein [Flavobacterium sp. 7A]|uniref:glycosyltransferase family 4 protein n=1 Tax=Flavobacterium sp. 7A TaxID=2940571 RepID=UPI0022272BD3|nr:glycosyltransferase family 4 protein [Flavobacterium sp. 7A]MCW2120284.1 glycosyltransferase involved in cell wall biosynthesis [Flavobacterium sp. 7A]
MKKVLFVHDGPIYTNDDKSIFYGVHYNDTLIQRYSYFGNSVNFLMRRAVVSEKDGQNFSIIKHPAFSFIEVPNFKSIKAYFKKTEAIAIIKKAVDEHDVIILRLPSAIGAIAFEYASSINKPILIEKVACVYDALWNYDWRGRLIASQKMKKYQDILQKASHTIYVTDHFLQSRYPTEGKSIGCSDVIVTDLDDAILNKRILKIVNLPKVITIGTVAAIDVPYKGQADVIQAIAILKKQNILFNYKIVGQGDASRLNKIIEQCQVADLVEVVGPLKSAEVFDFLDTLDLYIQPSKQEGLPRAVIEAMSRACPVLGSNIAGIPELINKNSLFKAGNVGAIVKLLRDLSKNSLEQSARENFLKAETFKKETLDSKREEFYKEFKKDFNLL